MVMMKQSRHLTAVLLLLVAVLQTPVVVNAQALTYCGESNDVYCLNEAPCKPKWQETPDAPCSCPIGYVGQRCEFRCEAGGPCLDGLDSFVSGSDLTAEPCDLKCENNGTCTMGSSEFTGIWTADEANMFCECPTGSTGTLCEHKVEICGDDIRICLHGSKCKLEAGGSYRCECSTAWTPESMFAGEFCQHHHTDMCTPSGFPEFFNGMAVPAFCVNDGVCKTVINERQEVNPGCDCPPLYEGPHCEYLVSKLGARSASPAEGEGSSDNSPGFAVMAILLVSLLGIVAMFAARRVSRRMRRKKEFPVNLQSFRDENFGALSPNGNTLFPAFSMDVVEGARLRDVELI